MSLLLVDLGNTNTVLGVCDGRKLVAHWRLTTRREQTADEYGVLIRNLFSGSGIPPESIDGVVLASVVPPLTGVLIELCRDYFGVEPLVIGPETPTGMPILYEPPGDVGADRIVNAVAGFESHGGPLIVVDFGTATTFDVVTRKGEYLGGVICPGVGISAEALFQRAARLPRVDVSKPRAVVGRSTVGSMQSGLYYGYCEMVEGLIRRIRTELGEQASVIATGGLAEALAQDIPAIETVETVLTLRGLRILWERNRPR